MSISDLNSFYLKKFREYNKLLEKVDTALDKTESLKLIESLYQERLIIHTRLSVFKELLEDLGELERLQNV